jgi:hypothetical protein
VTVLAAPVLGDRGVLGTIVSLAVTEQLRRVGVATVGEELKRAAESLSTRMAEGYGRQKDRGRQPSRQPLS